MAQWSRGDAMSCKFPDDFPEGCPPPEAKAEDMDNVYRAVESNPPTEDDFQRWRDEWPKKYVRIKGNRKIQANGLSFNKKKEELADVLKKVPGLGRKKKYIAVGMIKKEFGVTLDTPTQDSPNHFTLWKCLGVQMAGYFKVIEERSDNDV